MSVIAHWSNFMMTSIKFLSGNSKYLSYLRDGFHWLLFCFKFGVSSSWCDYWFSDIFWTFGQLCYELQILNLYQKVKGGVVSFLTNWVQVCFPQLASFCSLEMGDLLLLGGDGIPLISPWLSVKGRSPIHPSHFSPRGLHWHTDARESPHHHGKSSSCQSGVLWCKQGRRENLITLDSAEVQEPQMAVLTPLSGDEKPGSPLSLL